MYEDMVAQYTSSGMPLPKKLQNIPELLPGLELYLTAFYDLDTERQLGTGIGPIPHFKILEYANLYEIDDVIYFEKVIKSLDDWKLKEFKKELDGKTKPSSPKRRS